jgi:hypothetical protein
MKVYQLEDFYHSPVENKEIKEPEESEEEYKNRMKKYLLRNKWIIFLLNMKIMALALFHLLWKSMVMLNRVLRKLKIFISGQLVIRCIKF